MNRSFSRGLAVVSLLSMTPDHWSYARYSAPLFVTLVLSALEDRRISPLVLWPTRAAVLLTAAPELFAWRRDRRTHFREEGYFPEGWTGCCPNQPPPLGTPWGSEVNAAREPNSLSRAIIVAWSTEHWFRPA